VGRKRATLGTGCSSSRIWQPPARKWLGQTKSSPLGATKDGRTKKPTIRSPKNPEGNQHLVRTRQNYLSDKVGPSQNRRRKRIVFYQEREEGKQKIKIDPEAPTSGWAAGGERKGAFLVVRCQKIKSVLRGVWRWKRKSSSVSEKRGEESFKPSEIRCREVSVRNREKQEQKSPPLWKGPKKNFSFVRRKRALLFSLGAIYERKTACRKERKKKAIRSRHKYSSKGGEAGGNSG